MQDPALVVLAYDRPDSLRRVLGSIADANFGSRTRVPLVISIDHGGGNEVLRVAESFEWRYGEKQVIVRPEKLGMREHSLRCGDLSLDFGAVIFLEDDSFVAPYFYQYALAAGDFFDSDPAIAGVSLYAQLFNEITGLSFSPLEDGKDTFFIQSACTWGVLWTGAQWQAFREWLREYGSGPVTIEDHVPELVASWPSTSWKKYLNKYLVMQDKYFVYPRHSVLTNFADVGSHNEATTFNFQVPLSLGSRSWAFVALQESLAIYDAYFEIRSDCMKKLAPEIQSYDFLVDLSGQRPLSDCAELVLTSKSCRGGLRTYGFRMAQLEQNIIFNIPGDFFTLARPDVVGGLSSHAINAITKASQKDLGLVKYGRLFGDNLKKLVMHRLQKYFGMLRN